MADAHPRTLIDSSKLFMHTAPAFSTRSRVGKPAGVEIDDLQRHHEEDTQELSTSFLLENELQPELPSENLPSTVRELSVSDDDSDESQSNLSQARLANDFSDEILGSVQSERDAAEAFVNSRHTSRSSPLILHSRTAREPVDLVQVIKDNPSFRESVPLEHRINVHTSSPVPLVQNIRDKPSSRTVVKTVSSNPGIADSRFNSNEVRAQTHYSDGRESESINQRHSVNPTAGHAEQSRNSFRPAGRHDQTHSHISNTVIDLPSTRDSRNNEIASHNPDESRPILHYSDAPLRRREDEVSRNYFRPTNGQRDCVLSRLSNPLIPLPRTRVVSNKEVWGQNRVVSNKAVWSQNKDEIGNVMDRPIPIYSDMPSQTREDEVTGNYFSEDAITENRSVIKLAPLRNDFVNNAMTSDFPRYGNKVSREIEQPLMSEAKTTTVAPGTLQQSATRHATKSGLFCPAKFNGTTCAKSWLREVGLWFNFHSMTCDDTRVSAFGLLLGEGPSLWLRSLKSEDLTTFDRVAELFLKRYNQDKQLHTQTALLWNKCQGRSQSVEAFVEQVSVRADQLGVSTENAFLIALNGLLPQIRSMVLLKEPKTLEELLKYATLIESSVEPDTAPYAEIAQTLQEMKQSLARLQPQGVTALSAPNQQKHVTFSEHPQYDEFRTERTAWTNRNQNELHPLPWDYSSNRGNRDAYNPGNTYRNRPQAAPQPRVMNRGRGFTQSFNRPNSQPQQYYAAPSKTSTRTGCFNCGESHPIGRCGAWGARCAKCMRQGHYTHLCLTYPGQRQE